MDGQSPQMIDPPTDEQTEYLAKQIEDLDCDAESALSSLEALNGLIKGDVTQRMQGIISRFEGNYEELREAWNTRENARKLLNTKNSSLNFLLERVNEAKAKVFEPEVDDKKGKGKKK